MFFSNPYLWLVWYLACTDALHNKDERNFFKASSSWESKRERECVVYVSICLSERAIEIEGKRERRGGGGRTIAQKEKPN